MKRSIAIFGSTGSIGTQALEVIRANPDLFEVEILTAHTNEEMLIQQALEFKPNAVVIVDEKKYEKTKSKTKRQTSNCINSDIHNYLELICFLLHPRR